MFRKPSAPEPNVGLSALPPVDWAEEWAAISSPAETGPPAGKRDEPQQPQQPSPGRTEAIGSAVLSIILVGLLVIGVGYVGVRVFGPVQVSALKPGDCITSSDVRLGHRVIDGLGRDSCEARHAAEVVAVIRLTRAQVREFTPSAAESWCGHAVIEAGSSLNALAAQDLHARPLLQSRRPEPGDKLVCIARDATGDPLMAPISLT